MSADNHLSPHQFFHGSVHDIPVGGRILPNDLLGHESDSRSGAKAYATTDEETAWHFSSWNGAGGRGRVYAVTPGPGMNDKFKPEEYRSLGEVEADHFTVTHRLDIKPGHQGTFPDVDWGRHVRGTEWQQSQASHPSPEQVAEEQMKPLRNVRTQAGLLQERKHFHKVGTYSRKRKPGPTYEQQSLPL